LVIELGDSHEKALSDAQKEMAKYVSRSIPKGEVVEIGRGRTYVYKPRKV